MKSILSAIALTLALSSPAIAEPTPEEKIQFISQTICQEAKEDNLGPTLMFLVGQGGDELYYQVFRAITYKALTIDCPDQFKKLHEIIDGPTAESVPVPYYRVYLLITGLKSPYD
jgi:hypothetical protein